MEIGQAVNFRIERTESGIQFKLNADPDDFEINIAELSIHFLEGFTEYLADIFKSDHQTARLYMAGLLSKLGEYEKAQTEKPGPKEVPDQKEN
ncbi:hypothetical protein GWN42_13485 [candidate division KSB1 bacterium]|nr:hypothetical protein [candidate division KSB1 bacterium]